MVKWKELSRLPKSTHTSLLWRLQTQGSPNSILQPGWRPSNKPGEQYVEPAHPATRVPHMTFPRVRGNGLEIRLIPQACLRRPEVIYPFERSYITWEQRLAWIKEQGYTARVVTKPGSRTFNERSSPPRGGDARMPVLVDKDGKVVGAEKDATAVQLYPPLDWDTHVFPARRTEPQGEVRKMVLKRLERRVSMSLMTAMSKDRMGSKRYMRQRLVKKIKICLGLIVSKGAYSEEVVVEDRHFKAPEKSSDKTKKKGTPAKRDETTIKVEEQAVKAKPILFNAQEAEEMGRKWIMQGWTYLIFPTTALYLMPYSKIIAILRDNLKTVYDRGVQMENYWLACALLTSKDGNSKSDTPHKSDTGVKHPLGGSVGRVVKPQPTSADKTSEDEIPLTREKRPMKRPYALSSYPGLDDKTWHKDINAALKALKKHNHPAPRS